jgi:hypothetical protein
LGKIATNILAKGNGWSAGDVICTSGPQDRPFEEQHSSISIAVVVEGSFQYRSTHGSSVMSPGSLLLGNFGQYYECGHEHATGDRCLAFYYTPDFFERAHLESGFPIHRIPPISAVSPWIVKARVGIWKPDNVVFEELAFGLAEAVACVLERAAMLAAHPRRATNVVFLRRFVSLKRIWENHCRWSCSHPFQR